MSQPKTVISIRLAPSSRLSCNERNNTKKRSYTAFAEDQDGSDEDYYHQIGKSQAISFFGDNPSEPENAVNVAPQRNIAAFRLGRNLQPEEEQVRRKQAAISGPPGTDAEESRPQNGLIVSRIIREGEDEDAINATKDGVENLKSMQKASAQTTDEEAIDALLGNEKKSGPIIATPNSPRPVLESEIDSFRSDVTSRPHAASVVDYAATPISGFGAALLRGVGWKEGEVIGRRKGEPAKPRLLQKRPLGLGIGATQLPEEVEELGALGRRAREREMIGRGYSPLVLRNAQTGEILTEEDFRRREADENTNNLSDRLNGGGSRGSRYL